MSSDETAGAPFTEESARRALADACAKVGVSADGAELFRMGENAMFMLRHDGIVVRVARSDARIQKVEKELAVARWLASNDYPATRVADEIAAQPIHADGRLVTFWGLVEESGKASYNDLGALLRGMHALPAPDFELPQFTPFSAVPGRLANPGNADPSAVAFLSDLYHDVKDRYNSLEFALPLGVIHGDAHRGNVIVTPSGPILTDFEVVSWGPREWDLTPTALSMDRFGLPRETFEEFSRNYGFDVTQWPGYPVLRSVRELTMLTWLMQIIDVSPDRKAEFEHRIASMRAGKTTEPWHAF